MRKALTIIIIAFSLLIKGADCGEDDMSSNVRQPAVAGTFYPGEPSNLAKTIAGMMAQTERPDISGEIKALIAPHAGYIYSGPVASYAFKTIQGLEYSDVIVISPCHVEAFQGSAIYPGDAYRTPLGDIKINKELSTKIASASEYVELSEKGHRLTVRGGEHSLEVELPFLQTMLGDFNLVAIVMGNQDKTSCSALAEAIAKACSGRDDVLLVASSDLSHFYDYKTAKKLDSHIVDRINAYDYEALYNDIQSKKAEACGGGPMIVAMMAAKMMGADGAKVVRYANSGDVSGDSSSVVGYLAAVVYKGDSGREVYEINTDEESSEDLEINPASAVDFGLTSNEKQLLLDLARQSIEARLENRSLDLDKADYPGVLGEKRGAFVTLTIDDNLRGCIGYIQAVKPLYETIAEMAVQAAFHDPRFPQLSKAEFKQIEIEISVLTPMIKVENPEQDIVVGRDGLFIIKGHYSGLLLPQVPVEHNWNRNTFLDQTCLKAGLPPGTWKDSATEIYRFQADIFGGR